MGKQRSNASIKTKAKLISTITKEEMDERRRIYIETHKDEINAKLAKLLGDEKF